MTTGNESPANLPADIALGMPNIPVDFTDRRNPENQRRSAGNERRQFTNSFSEYSRDAAELGQAIDQYKLMHRRRFINFEELLSVIKSIGYEKTNE